MAVTMTYGGPLRITGEIMMAEDDDYFAEAKKALELAKAKRGGYRGDCADCAYSRSDQIGLSHCDHPAVTLVAFNLTDDYAKETITLCGEQRDTGSIYGPVVCGPNGVLFDERQQRVSLWRRIFG